MMTKFAIRFVKKITISTALSPPFSSAATTAAAAARPLPPPIAAATAAAVRPLPPITTTTSSILRCPAAGVGPIHLPRVAPPQFNPQFNWINRRLSFPTTRARNLGSGPSSGSGAAVPTAPHGNPPIATPAAPKLGFGVKLKTSFERLKSAPAEGGVPLWILLLAAGVGLALAFAAGYFWSRRLQRLKAEEEEEEEEEVEEEEDEDEDEEE